MFLTTHSTGENRFPPSLERVKINYEIGHLSEIYEVSPFNEFMINIRAWRERADAKQIITMVMYSMIMKVMTYFLGQIKIIVGSRLCKYCMYY